MLEELTHPLIVWVVTIVGVLYVLSPIDLLPDVIPIIGWTDDAFVIFLVIMTWIIYGSAGILENIWSQPIVKIALLVFAALTILKFTRKKNGTHI